MKEIIIISGKGGTGKTSITASLAYLSANNAVIADCDVDAADMHLLMQPDLAYTEDFFSGQLAEIDPGKCTGCGICAEKCRFNAIEPGDGLFRIIPLNCEGCGYCARVCPEEAIKMIDQKAGQYFISGSKFNNTLVHARLGIGAENSGKLVAKVKKEARRIALETGAEFIIVDGSPGIGCPVVSSLSGAHFVVLVTEPTVSGLHDLKRVYELVKRFNLRAGCIINKYDLNLEIAAEIINFLESESVEHISNIPYSEEFTAAMIRGMTIVEESNTNLKHLLENSWEKIKDLTLK